MFTSPSIRNLYMSSQNMVVSDSKIMINHGTPLEIFNKYFSNKCRLRTFVKKSLV